MFHMKTSIFALPYKLQNELRLTIFRNEERLEKYQNWLGMESPAYPSNSEISTLAAPKLCNAKEDIKVFTFLCILM